MISTEYGIDDIQLELLDIAKAFDTICRDEDIQYVLYGGSCLGAVRHGGFIPWDDDFDICVARDAYERLVEALSRSGVLTIHKELWIERVQKPNAKPIRGYIPTLDVFVVDRAPESKALFKLKIIVLKTLQGMIKGRVNLSNYPLLYRIPLVLTHSLGGVLAWLDDSDGMTTYLLWGQGLLRILAIPYSGIYPKSIQLNYGTRSIMFLSKIRACQ